MFPEGFDQYEDYSYLMDGSGGSRMPQNLDFIEWLLPLLYSDANRGMFNERGGYQDPYQPHYHAMRDIANKLGKDWQEVLFGNDLPAMPMRGENPYEFEFAGSSLLSEYLQAIKQGEYSPTTAASSLKERFDSMNDAELQLAMRAELPMSNDGGVDWGGVSRLFTNYMREESRLDRDYESAMMEYSSLPRYGFDEEWTGEGENFDWALQAANDTISRRRQQGMSQTDLLGAADVVQELTESSGTGSSSGNRRNRQQARRGGGRGAAREETVSEESAPKTRQQARRGGKRGGQTAAREQAEQPAAAVKKQAPKRSERVRLSEQDMTPEELQERDRLVFEYASRRRQQLEENLRKRRGQLPTQVTPTPDTARRLAAAAGSSRTVQGLYNQTAGRSPGR